MMMLFDKSALIKEIREVYEYEYPTASGAFDDFVTRIIPNIINNYPTVDVVRCKDCKHAPREEIIDGKLHIIEPKDEDGTTDYTCPYVCMDWYYTEVPDGDSFCNKGERKDGDQDDAKRTDCHYEYF